MRPEFSRGHEPRSCKSPRRDDEARFPALRPQPHSGARSPAGTTFPAAPFPPCCIPALRHGRRQRANLTASKTYSLRSDDRFDMKTFTELKNAQAIVLAYDGFNPHPPTLCYLKPYYNDPNLSYFEQLAKGQL